MLQKTTGDIVFFIGFLAIYSIIAALVWVVCRPFVYIKNKLKGANDELGE